MKFSVTSEKQNDFLGRKEVVVNVDYQGKATPKNADLIAELASHFGTTAEKIQAKLFSHNGISGGYAVVKVWSDKPLVKQKKVAATVEKK